MNTETKVTTGATETTYDIELPPLPKGDIAADTCPVIWVHSNTQLQAYARAAIEADRKRRGSIVNNASASSEPVAKIDPNPPQLSIVWHDSPESVDRAMWEQAACDAGVTYEDLIQGSNVGETENGELLEFTHEQAIEGMRVQGCWGFVDTKTNTINAWAADDVGAPTALHFLAHEIGHVTGEQLDDDMQEEMRAEQFGRVAALAYRLWCEKKNDAPQPAEPDKQHPDDVAVGAFAAAMKAKLKRAREEKGRGGWQDMSATELSAMLREHVEKGDPVDVANLAMMLHQNGQGITPAESVSRDVEALVRLLEDGEWAEHVARTPLGQRLELAITTLVGEASKPHNGQVSKTDWNNELSSWSDEDFIRIFHERPDLANRLRKMLAKPVKCIGCEGKPAPENNPCAVCGKEAEPVAAEFPVKGKLRGPLGWIATTTNPEPVEDSVDIDDFIAAFIARGDITKDAFLEARQWVRDTYYNPAEPVTHNDCDLSGQFERSDIENHRLRRAIQKIMARLTELLDEDQFATIEGIAMDAGVEPPAEPDEERLAMEAVMESVDPATWPGLTLAQRCALGRFAKPQPAESCASLMSDKLACGSENGDCDSQPSEPSRGEPVAWHSKQYGVVWMAIKPGNLVAGTQWFIQGRQAPVAEVVSPGSLVWHIPTSELEHGTVFFTTPQPAEPSEGETVLYTSQKALDLASRSDAVISVGVTRVPQMSWNVPLYTAPQPLSESDIPAEAVGGLNAEQLAEILTAYIKPEIIGEALEKLENAPWELSKPVKPHLTVKYDDKGDFLYICCDSNEPAEAEENDQGILLWRAISDGRLVGVTIPNFIGPYIKPVKVDAEASVPSDDALDYALSNLEHDNYEQSYSGYKNRQADIALIRAALARALLARYK